MRIQFKILVISIIIASACVKDEANIVEGSSDLATELQITESILIEVSEPSGLCYDPISGNLFTISDNTNHIYRIDENGNIFAEIEFDGNDLEGVAFRASDSTIWIVDEYSSEVICFSYEGNLIERFIIDIARNDLNNGLEGITFNNNNEHFYLLNETNPGLLIEWHPVLGIINQTELAFADDYSGINYSSSNNGLWIVSDESMTLHWCDLSGNSIKSYGLGKTKIEGLVQSTDENHFIGVCDADSKIYKFTLSE